MSPPCRFLKVCEEATRNPSSCEAKNAKFLHFPQPILWSKYYCRKTALSDILYWKKIVPKPRQRTLSAPPQRLENSISRFDRRPTCPAATTGCYGPPLCIRPKCSVLRARRVLFVFLVQRTHWFPPLARKKKQTKKFKENPYLWTSSRGQVLSSTVAEKETDCSTQTTVLWRLMEKVKFC